MIPDLDISGFESLRCPRLDELYSDGLCALSVYSFCRRTRGFEPYEALLIRDGAAPIFHWIAVNIERQQYYAPGLDYFMTEKGVVGVSVISEELMHRYDIILPSQFKGTTRLQRFEHEVKRLYPR